MIGVLQQARRGDNLFAHHEIIYFRETQSKNRYRIVYPFSEEALSGEMASRRPSTRRSVAALPTEISPLSRLLMKADKSSRRRSTLGLSKTRRRTLGTPGKDQSGTPGKEQGNSSVGSTKTKCSASRRSLAGVGVASNSWDDPGSQLSGGQCSSHQPGDVTSLSVQAMDIDSPNHHSKVIVGNTTSHNVMEMELDSPYLPRDQVSLLLPTDTPSPANQALVLHSDDDDDDMPPTTQPVDNRVLKDVVVYVEVRCSDTMDNRSKAVAKQLELLGARVEQKLSREVTHVVFKDGKKSTLDKATKKGIHLVSVLWVESCREKQVHVNEGLFPVSRPEDGSTPVLGRVRRFRSMQPKTFEEELAGSAERVRKRRRQQELANRWKTLAGTTPLGSFSNNATVYAEETQDPNNEETILPSMPLTIPDTPPNMREKINQLMARQENQASPLSCGEGRTSQKRLFVGAESEDNCAVIGDVALEENKNTASERVQKQRRRSRRLSSFPTKHGETEQDTALEGSSSVKQSAKSGPGKRRLLSTLNSDPSIHLVQPQKPEDMAAASRVQKTVGVLSGKRDQTPVSGKTNSRDGAGKVSLDKGIEASVQTSARMDSNKETAAAKRKWNVLDASSSDEDEQVGKKGKHVVTDPVLEGRGSKAVKTGGVMLGLDWDSDSSDGLGELAARASARALASLKLGSKNKRNQCKDKESSDESDSAHPKPKLKGHNACEAQNTHMTHEKKPNMRKQDKKAERKSCRKSLNSTSREPLQDNLQDGDLTSSQHSIVGPLRPSRRSLEDFVPPQKASQGYKKRKDLGRCSRTRRGRSSSGSSNSSTGEKDGAQPLGSATATQAKRQTKPLRNPNASDLDSSTSSSSSTGAARPMSNRRSRQKYGKKEKRSLVMTSMHTKDQELLISVIKQLGGFCLERTVSDRTTHVVSGCNRRTLNVLNAIARGCWLVSLEWVLKSMEVGRFVEEEPYELYEMFPAAQVSRLERQAADIPYKQDLFTACGLIYISEHTSPPTPSLARLVELCGGAVCTSFRRARIVVGNPRRRTDALVVTELWVLDSITEHSSLPLDTYLVQPEKTRRASSPEF